jgi:ubiquitin-conjugating enzyme E2 R
MAQKRLMQELRALQKEKWVDITVGASEPIVTIDLSCLPYQTDEINLLRWKIGLWVVNPDSVWHGAFLRVRRTIPIHIALRLSL